MESKGKPEAKEILAANSRASEEVAAAARVRSNRRGRETGRGLDSSERLGRQVPLPVRLRSIAKTSSASPRPVDGRGCAAQATPATIGSSSASGA